MPALVLAAVTADVGVPVRMRQPTKGAVRQWLGYELNPEYAAIAEARIRAVQPGLSFGDAA
jgi:hypothetical protein